MIEIFGQLRRLLAADNVSIDNNVFRLHYKATVVILVSFSLLVTARQYVGDPIDCIVEGGVPYYIMDTYCWVTSTFTLTQTSGTAVHPGVDVHGDGDDAVVIHHKYYQWVCFALFFQAMFFYAPRYLWKTWEGGRIRALVLDLDSPVVEDRQRADERVRALVDYFIANLHTPSTYLLQFVFCEVLNFVNVVGQMLFMDYFLDHEFSSYGVNVFRFTQMSQDARGDPMSRMFPKVAKCTFHSYGHTGTVQNFDGLCVLPLNYINEMIYLFLWFWFYFVAAASSLALVYRLSLLVPNFRLLMLRARSRLSSKHHIKTIVDNFRVGDWFVLYQLGMNINPLLYRDLILGLAEKLDAM